MASDPLQKPFSLKNLLARESLNEIVQFSQKENFGSDSSLTYY